MIGTVEGELFNFKIKQPEAGQEFKPHILISLVQEYEDDAEMVKIKDYDLTRQYKKRSMVKLECKINHWSMNNSSGQAISVLRVLDDGTNGTAPAPTTTAAKAKEKVKL